MSDTQLLHILALMVSDKTDMFLWQAYQVSVVHFSELFSFLLSLFSLLSPVASPCAASVTKLNKKHTSPQSFHLSYMQGLIFLIFLLDYWLKSVTFNMRKMCKQHGNFEVWFQFQYILYFVIDSDWIIHVLQWQKILQLSGIKIKIVLRFQQLTCVCSGIDSRMYSWIISQFPQIVKEYTSTKQLPADNKASISFQTLKFHFD